MVEPLVSIIMGAYNCGDVVANCIDSVINQTYKNWEFIICDDCSMDNTLEVLEEYKKKDARIHIIHNEKNMKLAASLNNCLAVAKGEYIARMDVDDIMVSDRLEQQVDFLNNNLEYDVVGANAKITDGNVITGIRKTKKIPRKKDVLLGPPYIHPSIMMRKETYNNLGGYTIAKHTKRGQDWDLWFRFYAKGYKGYNLQKALIIYHESREDYKKRTLTTSVGYTKTALNGYRLLGVEFWKYIFAFKPIFSYFVPEVIKKKRRNEEA